MRRMVTIAILMSAGIVLLVLLGSGSVRAQTAASDQRLVDSLVEQIKAAKAEMARRAAAEEQATAPDETQKKAEKPAEKPKAAKKPTRTQKEEGGLGIGTDRYRLLRQGTGLPSSGLGGRYDLSETPEDILNRIRAERAAAGGQGPKGTEAKPAEEGGIPMESGLRNFREMIKQYSPDRVYLAQPKVPTGIVGTGMLPGPPGGATVSRVTGVQLPDPSTQPDEYAQALTDQFGVRAALPQFADPSLRSTYEAQRFRNLLFNDQGVYVAPGNANISQLYNTYKTFQSLPGESNSLGKRDAYVANSQNFVSSTYRGSIYSNPYSNDPYARSVSPYTTQSKYSSTGYYSLDTRESFSDYYQRELGVNATFVPGSASRLYEINTVKQWTNTIRDYYGTQIRPGEKTFADTYRLYSGERRY